MPKFVFHTMIATDFFQFLYCFQQACIKKLHSLCD